MYDSFDDSDDCLKPFGGNYIISLSSDYQRKTFTKLKNNVVHTSGLRSISCTMSVSCVIKKNTPFSRQYSTIVTVIAAIVTIRPTYYH